MKFAAVFALLLIAAVFGTAQSLKSESPYALKSGINVGTSDSLVGAHYWYFYVLPGNNRMSVRFRNPTTLYGAPMNNNVLTITATDEKRSWKVVKTVSGSKNSSEATFIADNVKTRQKVIVIVDPPHQNLLRMGGDYEIEVTGNVEFGENSATQDPVIRTYAPKVMHYSEDYGAVKFKADGTVETANGFSGTWKVFDKENRIYTVQLGKIKYSLQYLPGYGLVRPSDRNMIEFQELRR